MITLDYLNYPRLNSTFGKSVHFMGIDDLRHTNNKTIEKFLTYNYPISYKFNSRGFRDDEWPTDLSDVIWCVGDSFTTGIGVPYEHTWPFILQHKLGKRCIKLGFDGASNQLIRKVCLQILNNYESKIIIPMWSFFHRRHKDPWHMLQYDENLDPLQDYNLFLDCYREVNKINLSCKIINLLITHQSLSYELPEDINLFQTSIVDTGRDAYHFDYKTAEIYVEHILSKIS